MATDSSTFSSILQSLRKERKVTQEQLATYLGVSPQAVSKWENGSYPEGDLLPRIADYFSVSIDYMYGRAEKEKSIEQKVLEYFKDAIKAESEHGRTITQIKDYWEKFYDIIWAMQISPWGAQKNYFGRSLSDDPDSTAASAVYNNEGYSFMNLDRGNEFYMMIRKSELDGGFAHWMKHSDKVRDLFKMLSDGEHVRILMYLFTLGLDEYANIDTITSKTGVKKDKVEKFMNYMMSDISEDNYWKYPMNMVRLASKSGSSEVAYGADMNLAGLFFGLFNIADTIIHNPNGYNMQIANRSEPWLNWDDVK